MAAPEVSREGRARAGRPRVRTLASTGTVFWLAVLAFHYLYIGTVTIHQSGVAGQGSNAYIMWFFAVVALAAGYLCWSSAKAGFLTAITMSAMLLALSAAQGAEFMFGEVVFGTMANFLILFFGLETYRESFAHEVGHRV